MTLMIMRIFGTTSMDILFSFLVPENLLCLFNNKHILTIQASSILAIIPILTEVNPRSRLVSSDSLSNVIVEK